MLTFKIYFFIFTIFYRIRQKLATLSLNFVLNLLCRFEKPRLMEYQDIVITPQQNNVDNG